MKQKETHTFGEFLYSKRSSPDDPEGFRDATRVEKSASFMCDLENDRRDPPNRELLAKIVEVLSLGVNDSTTVVGLAGKGREEVFADLPSYIMKSKVSDSVHLALRTRKITMRLLRNDCGLSMRYRRKTMMVKSQIIVAYYKRYF